jgi:hypothetical protein
MHRPCPDGATVQSSYTSSGASRSHPARLDRTDRDHPQK